MARLHARLPLPLFHVVEHGYVDLHFPIDQEVVTYDVHVAVQWYEDPNAVRAPDPQICERLLSDDEDECAKCGEGGQLVGCEGTDCNRWFHVRCQPKSDPFPHLDGPAWYCEECLGAEWAPSQGERRLVSALHDVLGSGAALFSCAEHAEQRLPHFQHAQPTDASVGTSMPERVRVGSLERGADSVGIKEGIRRHLEQQQQGHR